MKKNNNAIIKDDFLDNFESEDIYKLELPKVLPILPLKDIVLFPYMIYPILIGRTQSLKAVSASFEKNKFIFLTAQKNSEADEPQIKDLYKHGTVCRILQVLRLPNNLLKVLVEGILPAKIIRNVKNKNEYLQASIEVYAPIPDMKDKQFLASIRKTHTLFKEYIKFNNNMPSELISAFDSMPEADRKLYFAAANLDTPIEKKQAILEKTDLKSQFMELIKLLRDEIDMLKLEDEIEFKIQDTINKSQKKYYIQEQIRALQGELDEDEEYIGDLSEIKVKIEKSGMHEEAKKKAYDELEKLQKTHTMSPDYSVNRNYLDWLVELPWHNKTKDNLNIGDASTILDRDHYNMEKPKERILEYIALLNVTSKLRRQILCFVGPPGVGKTSLARSIADSLGRKFVRFSLGGIRDEAEIRGHRRTYVGAMPGKIIQLMKKAGTINPVILLDEIDKMLTDFRGDPSAALLEVLDPEQNDSFNDHYLEVDYDLSNVLFITTANVRYDIPHALQDRMDFIELNSYLDFEKIIIAKRYIIPKLIKEYGLSMLKIHFEDSAIKKIINEYTRESGVRNLERQIGAVLRQINKTIVQEFYQTNTDEKSKKTKTMIFAKYKNKKIIINDELVQKHLKTPIYKHKNDELQDKVGVATGLAWTSTGGEILPIEIAVMPGAEKLIATGKLGDVMKESATTSLSYIRSNNKLFELKDDFFEKKEIHIHIPEGAIPKDGPSAGTAMTTALVSAFTGKAVRGDLAMTGEITLRGNVLPIGGLNEKLLAAKRAGMKTVIIPDDNLIDLIEMKPEIKENIEIIAVKNYSEIIDIAFRK